MFAVLADAAAAVDAVAVPDSVADLTVGRVYSTHVLFMHHGAMMAFWPSPTVDKRAPIAEADAAKLCAANGVAPGSAEARIKLTNKPIEVRFEGYANHTPKIALINPKRNYDVTLTREQRALQEQQLAANRAAAPPARGASLDALAAAEVRSIMHGLSLRELLRMARCSRRMRDMAQSSHAFRHVTPVNVDPVASPAAFSAHVLLRHAPLNMRLRYAVKDESAEALVARLAGFVSAHRVVSMETAEDSGFTLSVPLLAQLFAHPAMQSLRCVKFADALSVSLWTSGALLPLVQLRSLVVHPSQWKDRVQPGAAAAAKDASAASSAPSPVDAAPVLPALTSVSVLDECDIDSAALSFLSQCAGLRHLAFSVQSVSTYGRGNAPSAPWKQLGSPARFAASLQSLVLTRFHAEIFERFAGVGPEVLDAVFRSLVSLRSLTLVECAGTELILPHVSRAPQLCQLTVKPLEAVRMYDRACVITPKSLSQAAAALLRAVPSIRYTLVVFAEKQSGPVASRHAVPFGFGDRCSLVVLP